jgi:hypothetical protein
VTRAHAIDVPYAAIFVVFGALANRDDQTGVHRGVINVLTHDRLALLMIPANRFSGGHVACASS